MPDWFIQGLWIALFVFICLCAIGLWLFLLFIGSDWTVNRQMRR